MQSVLTVAHHYHGWVMENRLNTELTGRQQRELDYHRKSAEESKRILALPFSWDVLQNPGRRWWNAYWKMYAYLLTCELKDKKVLIVGCGFGDDALRIAKLGANVCAFDLSPDSLLIARALAAREGLTIIFDEMPAENMRYNDDSFDYIIARDILHHVDIPLTMKEIIRVAKPNAILVVNEIYSHSFTNKIRNSALVEKILYPRMRRMIYGPGKPYITEDERKLTEMDMKAITKSLQISDFQEHFNCVVTRIIPEKVAFFAKLDYLLLRLLKPIGSILAGRMLFSARIQK